MYIIYLMEIKARLPSLMYAVVDDEKTFVFTITLMRIILSL